MANPIVLEDLEYIYNGLTERDRFQGSKILVTGCAGFLGYYFLRFFCQYAKELGVEKVIGLDNFQLGKIDWIEKLAEENSDLLELKRFDISKDSLSDVEGAEDCQYVIHMASIASPTFYRQFPIETMDANIWGLRRLFDFYKDSGLKGFLFFSSSEIYGDPTPDQIPTPETYRGNVACVGPRACYDESKRFGETMCFNYAEQWGLPISVARPFNNYGPGMNLNDKRVPADFAKAVWEKRDIEILSDGSPTRTFCYISDAVLGYLKVLLHGKFDFFNIGIDKPEISIRRLAEIYVEKAALVLGYEGQATFQVSEDKDYLVDNPNRRSPVIDKAKSVLGYNPSILVEEGIERFLKFIKVNEGQL